MRMTMPLSAPRMTQQSASLSSAPQVCVAGLIRREGRVELLETILLLCGESSFRVLYQSHTHTHKLRKWMGVLSCRN